MIESYNYNNLEDDDRFGSKPVLCPGCGYDFECSTRYAAPCFYCGTDACNEDDPRIQECGGTIIDPKTKEVVWACRNCRNDNLDPMAESYNYNNLEDDDRFDTPIDYTIVYRKPIKGANIEIWLLADNYDPHRWEVGWWSPTFDLIDNEAGWYELGEGLDIHDIATWVGLNWKSSTPQDQLIKDTKDHIYRWFYKEKDKWEFPPEWSMLLWQAGLEHDHPPADPPNWEY
jgi:hypothetical protein